MVTNNSCDQSPTQYNVQTGGASGTLNNVAPSATSGVPVISQGASSQPIFGTAVVAGGGTGIVTTTAYGVICGGTTATGALQNAGAGTSGQILQSGGASALPAYTTATYPATTTSQQILYSTAANTVGQLTTANSSFPATNSSGTLAMRAFSVVRQVFTSTGTYTPTAGMLYCDIEVVGGGGGGGSVPTQSSTQASGGGGGGGGGYARGLFSASTIGASKSVTIGGAGTGGVANGAAATGGGTTSVGSTLISATGGAGGTAGATYSAIGAAGGGGGAGSLGDFQTTGSPGAGGFGAYVGFGGCISGVGGSSYFGGGGIAVGGVNTTPNGNTANSYGGGGSGAAGGGSAMGASGGNGAKGVVVITEYVIA